MTLVVTRGTAFDPARVTSDNMAPTVCTGDGVVIDHLAATRALTVGDIVTFPPPPDGTEQIKRIVAMAGQGLAIADAYCRSTDGM